MNEGIAHFGFTKPSTTEMLENEDDDDEEEEEGEEVTVSDDVVVGPTGQKFRVFQTTKVGLTDVCSRVCGLYVSGDEDDL